ncbi:MAG TPA: hypothetical protein VKW09_06035 [bacterium]|nr:hypothetical protein [bacterium]
MRLGTAAVLCLGAALALPFLRGAVQAAPSYPLYYAFEIPPVLTGYELDDRQERHLVYTAVLRGTLGGLPVQRAAMTLRPGASAAVGGGDFSLQTAAGAVKNGLILMTTDKRQASLWFSGTYLGARLAFHVVGPVADFGAATLAASGLADTTFADHSNYLAAVTEAVAGLAPAARAEALTEADRNVGLVTTYRQQTGTP